MTTEIAQILIRRGTTAEWTAANPVTPGEGELCINTTLKTIKIGDGSTAYASLANFNIGLTQAEVDQLANIGTSTVSAAQWGYLGALNQALATTDTTRFAKLGIGMAAVKDLDVTGEIRASTGILFGTDTAAANTLDDYDEGTFTATLAGADPPTTPVTTTGYYTKTGDEVYISFEFNNVNTTGATGQIQVTGCPFTALRRSVGSMWQYVILSWTNPVSPTIPAAASTIDFSEFDSVATVDATGNAGAYLRVNMKLKV
jgi:hypothetical protein